MTKGDFYSSELSTTIMDDTEVTIELVDDAGKITVLKDSVSLQAGEVIDAAFLNMEELASFYEREMQEAKTTDILFSLHLKATMMKVSDPILFSHCVKLFYKEAFEKHADVWRKSE